jgi:hypothetical protein
VAVNLEEDWAIDELIDTLDGSKNKVEKFILEGIADSG